MGIWDNARAKKEQNDVLIKKMKQEKQLFSSMVKYSGGHREISKACDGVLVINKLGVFFRAGVTKVIHIPIESITTAEYLDGSQVSKDVTLTRLLLVGIFAFGLKKKRKEEHHFVVISYVENGIGNKIIFENKKAPEAVGAIMEAKHLYASNEPMHSEKNTIETVNNLDIPDQIKKLAELKEEGIITEEEFQSKKTDLLSRL